MFCVHCGREIPEGYICNCPGSVQEREQRRSKNPFVVILNICKSWWKNPLDAKTQAEGEKSWAAAGILAGALFLINLIFEMFFHLGLLIKIWNTLGIKGGSMPAPYLSFNFWRILLAALVNFMLIASIYFVCKLTACLMTKRSLGGDFFSGCFMDFAVDCIPLCVILFTGGILSFLLPNFGTLFGASAFLYEMIVLAPEFHNGELFIATSKWKTLIVYGIAIVFIFIVINLSSTLTIWSVGISDMIDGVANSFGRLF